MKRVEDFVNHPKHYTTHPSGIEAIQITEHMNFCLGNAMKYIWRAGEKGAAIQDLQKAIWYLNREIERLQHGTRHSNSSTGSELTADQSMELVGAQPVRDLPEADVSGEGGEGAGAEGSRSGKRDPDSRTIGELLRERLNSLPAGADENRAKPHRITITRRSARDGDRF
jgi:hypothetical protein